MRYHYKTHSFPYRFSCPNPECEVDLEATVYSGRPAPPCSNPDSPAYSDSGDPGEIDGPNPCPKCNTPFDYDSIFDRAIDCHSYDYDGPEYSPEDEWDKAEARALREADEAKHGNK